MRELATVQELREINPIEDADAIELAYVMGWRCVVKKGEFKAGDLGIYFEIDSFLPVDERYEFLRKSCYRNNEFMGEGFRIKTMRFRGELSQGLFLPLDVFPNLKNTPVGTDVTEVLGVKKWEIPERVTTGGLQKGNKPYGIPTTDETRIQSSLKYLEKLAGHEYYITTKMDGTSCTVYYKDGEVGVCGRNYEYADPTKDESENKGSPMWDYVYKMDLHNKMRELGLNIAIQGEFCAPGIQKNRLKLKEPELYVFDVVHLGTLQYLSLYEIIEITDKLGLKRVPLEEHEENFAYTLEELLEKARGKYPSGNNKEGIVVRSNDAIDRYHGRISFKVINNDFLLKEEE